MASHSAPAPAPTVVWIRRVGTPAPDGVKRARKGIARDKRARRGDGAADASRAHAIDFARDHFQGPRTQRKPKSRARAARRAALLAQGGSKLGNS